MKFTKLTIVVIVLTGCVVLSAVSKADFSETSAGIVLPADKRIDFFTSGNLVSAYLYDSPEESLFFMNSGGKSFTVSGTGFFQAFSINPTTSPATNKTVMFVVTNNGGSVSLRQVEVGAADSAGSGYRTLRVAN